MLCVEVDAQDPFAMPTVVFIATGIELIWSNRLKSAGTSEAAMRAELEARPGEGGCGRLGPLYFHIWTRGGIYGQIYHSA